MNMQTVGEIIQFIVAPVVMIPACALVLNGLLMRYGAVNDRLRLLSRERLELLRGGSDALSAERLKQIDWQLPNLLVRHKQAHDAVLLIYCSIFLFICDMLVIAAQVISGLEWMEVLILGFFLAALLAIMVALAIAVREVYGSHRAIRYECEQVVRLNAPTPAP
jgi:hypothetical protein